MPREGNREITSKLPSNQDDSVERRRLLNILAQRRYRQRRRQRIAELEAQVQTNTEQAGPSSNILSSESSLPILDQDFSTDPTPFEDPRVLEGVPLTDFSLFPSSEGFDLGDLNVDHSALQSDSDSSLALSSTFDLEDLISHFAHEPNQPNNSSNNPHSFPLPPNPARAQSTLNPQPPQQYRPATAFADYLITVPGLNFIRAHVEIFQVMHGPSFHVDPWNPLSLSPFTTTNSNNPNPLLPSNFQPTPLQLTLPHHPVLDALPWPSFRDKFLYVTSLPEQMRPQIAKGDLANATMTLMGIMKDAAGGLRVWGSDPFDEGSWEVGQLFYSKFWWAIDRDVVGNSNRLRRGRGEDVLRVVQEL